MGTCRRVRRVLDLCGQCLSSLWSYRAATEPEESRTEMTAANNLATVISLACLTADRSPDEQKALLAVALQCDQQRGKFTITMRDASDPYLFFLVQQTYDPSDDDRIEPSKDQWERYGRLVAKWKPCPKCGKPVGAHAADKCREALYG